jgi:hypothetical protein
MLITTSTNATIPGALPEGSFARATLAPGPNVVVIDVASDGYVGQLVVKVAYGGEDGELRAVPFGPGASATGAWFATIPGPGYVYVVATALSSGQPDVTLRCGPGSQAEGTSLVPITTTLTTGETIANAWVLALEGGQGHSHGFVRKVRDQGDDTPALVISIVAHGEDPPAGAVEDAEMFGPIDAATTYPLGTSGSTAVDVYVRADDDSQGAAFLAWGCRFAPLA